MRTVRKMFVRAVVAFAGALPQGLVEVRTITPERRMVQPGCQGQGC